MLALFKSQQDFFPSASHFLLVFTSLPAGMNCLTSTASAHTSLQYFLPDSLHGDHFCLTLVCSVSIANTSVSTSFIQISLFTHLREFCFLLGPWWIGWVYRVLYDRTSLLPSLPTLHCVFQPWQGWGEGVWGAISFTWAVLPHPLHLAKFLLSIPQVAMYLKWFVGQYQEVPNK